MTKGERERETRGGGRQEEHAAERQTAMEPRARESYVGSAGRARISTARPDASVLASSHLLRFTCSVSRLASSSSSSSSLLSLLGSAVKFCRWTGGACLRTGCALQRQAACRGCSLACPLMHSTHACIPACCAVARVFSLRARSPTGSTTHHGYWMLLCNANACICVRACSQGLIDAG